MPTVLRSSLGRLFMVVVVAAWLADSARAACPFCDALQPTFAERRAEAQALLIGEVAEAASGAKPAEAAQPEKSALRAFTVRQVIDGAELVGSTAVVSSFAPGAKPGGLAILLGTRADADAALQQKIHYWLETE